MRVLIYPLAFVAALFACQIPPVVTAPEDPTNLQPNCYNEYIVGGIKWMHSCKDEIVHFYCPVGRKYIVSLDSKSMVKAGIPKSKHRLYLKALKDATMDWGRIMACKKFKVELNAPYADTKVSFAQVKYKGVLAYAYRAGNIIFDAKRKWFVGSKQKPHWGPKHEYSFYWVVAHELGHVWGINHSKDIRALLYPSQAAEGRWSWYEKLAGRILYLARWYSRRSIAYRTKRFFVKTSVAEIKRLIIAHRPRR